MPKLGQDHNDGLDPLAPFDLSHLCDGRRTDFPLGMLVDTVRVMLNYVYLQEDLDFLLRHKDGQSKIELRLPPRAGDRLVVLRVPAPVPDEPRPAEVDDDVPPYAKLPRRVKDNISAAQWPLAYREVVHTGITIPETANYINLKNGKIRQYMVGETADGPLLPVFDLAGARGKDDTQFRTTPPRAHFPR
jgi:hypothetical protein